MAPSAAVGDLELMRYTRKSQSLPSDPSLKGRARALRRARILHEVLLWRRLRKGQLHGLDFDRQRIIGTYIVDFYCSERSVVIEVDGASHRDRLEYDEARQAYLENLGLTVIRIPAREVLQRLDVVMAMLAAHPHLLEPPALDDESSAPG
jgi:very-short-patch-repair endonuclease